MRRPHRSSPRSPTAPFSERCHAEIARLRESIDQHGWDGEWYRRAYFDDGSPLGSASNPECRIDSIPQSWSVLSGAGDPARTRPAMDAVDKLLVRRQDALIQLLDPPFDHSALNPGYIKGYVPGVRENGGQYTHAAIWATMAFARLGDSRRAWELFGMINPIHHAVVRGADRQIQSRALCRRRRRLRRRAPHRPRRLDLVHGLGRLDLPPDHGIPTGPARRRIEAPHRSLHARRVDRLHHPLPLSRNRVSRPHRQSRRREAASLTLDGTASPEPWITLVDDHKEHSVEVRTAFPIYSV